MNSKISLTVNSKATNTPKLTLTPGTGSKNKCTLNRNPSFPHDNKIMRSLWLILWTISPLSTMQVFLNWGFCWWGKTPWSKKHFFFFGRKGLFSLDFHLTVHHQRKLGLEFKQGTWSQELKQWPWSCVAFWISPHALLEPAFLYTQGLPCKWRLFLSCLVLRPF